MNPIITFTGSAATTVGMASNRTPEIFDPTHVAWRSAHSMAAARRFASDDPHTVRLRCGARALLEDVLRQPIPSDTTREDMATMARRAMDEVDPNIDHTKYLALNLIAMELEGTL